MPGPLISARDISAGAVTTPSKQDFDTRLGKTRECYVYFSFGTADEDYTMPHALGRKPNFFTVVKSGGTSAGAPTAAPIVYARDQSFWATRNVVMLRSNTADSWAVISLR